MKIRERYKINKKQKTMKQIIYLKRETYGNEVVAFNENNLSRVEIYAYQQSKIKQFDDLESFNYFLSHDINKGEYRTISRTEFNEAAKAYTQRYNELIKEL